MRFTITTHNACVTKRFACRTKVSFPKILRRIGADFRGVTRLDVARGKKQVWRPHVRTWYLSDAYIRYWRKCLQHCWDFSTPTAVNRRPIVIRRPGNCAPLAPFVPTPTKIQRRTFQFHKWFSSLMKVNVMRLKFQMHSLHFSDVLCFVVLGSLGWTVMMMSNSMLSTTNNVLERLLKHLVPETVDDEIPKWVGHQEDCCNLSCNNSCLRRFRKSIRSIKQSKRRLTKSEISDNI